MFYQLLLLQKSHHLQFVFSLAGAQAGRASKPPQSSQQAPLTHCNCLGRVAVLCIAVHICLSVRQPRKTIDHEVDSTQQRISFCTLAHCLQKTLENKLQCYLYSIYKCACISFILYHWKSYQHTLVLHFHKHFINPHFLLKKSKTWEIVSVFFFLTKVFLPMSSSR